MLERPAVAKIFKGWVGRSLFECCCTGTQASFYEDVLGCLPWVLTLATLAAALKLANLETSKRFEGGVRLAE
jgi:hypothetical protein